MRPSPTGIYAGVRILAGRSNTAVRNGTIRGFTIGVTIQATANGNDISGLALSGDGQGVNTQTGVQNNPLPTSDNNVIHANTIDSNTSSAAQITGVGNRFEENSVTNNRFGLSIAGTGAVVRANRIVNNLSTGINANGQGAILSGNTVIQNSGNAINIGGPSTAVVLEGNRIEGNEIAQNGDPANSFGAINVFSSNNAVVSANRVVGIFRGTGVFAAANTVGTTISGNAISWFVDGVSINNGATNTLISGNQATQNTDDGFDVRSASTTIVGNTAMGNADWGIVAVPGVTDGGGNHAGGNGHPGQCAGVVCT